jgi:chromosomal replication initiator protein
MKVEQSVLTIQVPNKFFYEWLEEHYLGILKIVIRRELGERGKLEYQIKMNRTAETKELPSKNNEKQEQRPYGHADQIKNPFVIPGIRRVKIDARLNSTYSFSNFIEGDCNRLARSAGLAVAKKPGKTAFNPLFIFGDVGLGKTHLAQAIGNQIVDSQKEKTVLYLSSEKFTNQLIESIKNGEVNDFVNFYQLIDVLIIDDIQFLANKVKTQEIFFHIFNQLHQSGKQLVITSDRPPKDLDGMEQRLISRFKWGLSADLQVPELETRMAILKAKMAEEEIYISDDVLEFISYNIKNNIRELEGVLISLIAQAGLNRQEIDIDLAKQVIRNFVKEISKEVTIEYIQQLVAEHFEIPVEKLNAKTRKHSVVVARQLSMYLAKNLTNQPLKVIGNKFGGRDHSTVIYSCKMIQNMLDTDSMFKGEVEGIQKKIALSMT